MRGAWLASVALCACVASESGNPAQRCNDSSSCEAQQFCYRGFCVEDEQQVDPVETADDAAGPVVVQPDADLLDAALADASASDAAFVDAGEDAGPEAGSAAGPQAGSDAGATGASVADAGGRDAGRADAGRDAGRRPDAGVKCRDVCKPPGQNGSACRKCVKNTFGEDVEELCGKADKDDEDKALNAVHDPFCIALCLGAASTDPSCAGQLLCSGKKCGGAP
jgi:hypothetical protein